MKKLLTALLFFTIVPILLSQTSADKNIRMNWFRDAKLGIFIHWGIYSVNGIDESWSFYNNYISYDDYMKQLDGFTASNYDPSQWAALIKESGARYTVLTSKHHDGVALWNTKLSDLNVVKKTPAARDLIQPFVNEIRKKEIKVGLYYSMLDWSHPDYPFKTRTEKRYESDSVRWSNFLKFNEGQIGEICSNYKPDLLWFDGDWDFNGEQWKAGELVAKIRAWTPEVIINSRIGGHGDYDTPEQGVPIFPPKNEYWELCMTMNNSWGYQHNDTNYKTPNQIIRIFTDVISMGGNLLLDIGPKEDGTIPDEQINILKELGRWTNKHEEAIFGTRAGIPKEYFNGYSTLSENGEILYLFLDNKPSGQVLLKGIMNKVNRIWVVGNGTKLKWDIVGKSYWSKVPGLLYIDIPEYVLDEQVTVIAVLLDGKLELFHPDK